MWKRRGHTSPSADDPLRAATERFGSLEWRSTLTRMATRQTNAIAMLAVKDEAQPVEPAGLPRGGSGGRAARRA